MKLRSCRSRFRLSWADEQETMRLRRADSKYPRYGTRRFYMASSVQTRHLESLLFNKEFRVFLRGTAAVTAAVGTMKKSFAGTQVLTYI